MLKMRSKILAFLLVTVILTACFVTIGQAATKKTLSVWFGSVRISHNNTDVTTQVSPIMINGTTYLPLRSMAYLFNKDIGWVKSTNTVELSDKNDSTVTDLNNQITILNSQVADLRSQVGSKDIYIQQLLEKIKSLENTISSMNSSSSINIDDLEESLNDDFDSYKGAEFEITLSGDEDDITVTIQTDEEDWEDITGTYQKKYLQDIANDILDEFDDADISGKVKDGSSTLTEFSVSSDGNVEIDSSSTVNKLKSQLNDKLDDDYFGTLPEIDNDDLEITLEGDTDELTFTINIDLDEYESDWDDLSDSVIRNYMNNIYKYITDQDDFEDTEVIGYFYDTDDDDNIAKLYNDGSSFKRY